MLGVDVLREDQMDKILGPKKKKGARQQDKGDGKVEDLEAPPAWERDSSAAESPVDISRRVCHIALTNRGAGGWRGGGCGKEYSSRLEGHDVAKYHIRNKHAQLRAWAVFPVAAYYMIVALHLGRETPLKTMPFLVQQPNPPPPSRLATAFACLALMRSSRLILTTQAQRPRPWRTLGGQHGGYPALILGD